MRANFGFLLGVAALLIGPGGEGAFAQANPSVAFTNATGSYVQQFHLLPDGSKNRHAEIAPGAVAHVVSNPNQTWVFEISGRVVGSYLTEAAPNQSYMITGKFDPADEAPMKR
jgi:hypothetical protein